MAWDDTQDADSSISFGEWNNMVTYIKSGIATSGNLVADSLIVNTDDLYVAGDGKVGIGTTTPELKFDVRDTATPGLFWRHNTGGGTTFVNRISRGTVASPTQTLSGDVSMFLFQGYSGASGVNMARITAEAEANIVVGDAPSALVFETTPDGSGTVVERMRITSAGNVGVGETNPDGKFHVDGAYSTTVPLSLITGTGNGAYTIGQQILSPDMVAGNEVMFQIGTERAAYNAGQFYFAYAGDGSTSNRMSIGLHSADDILNVVGTSRVGIGTTTPGVELDVQGDISIPANNKLYLDDVGNDYIYSTGTAFKVVAAGSTRMTVDSGGISPGTGGHGMLNSTAPSGTVPGFKFRDDVDTGVGRVSADILSLIAGGVSGLTIKETATHAVVGIGTISPILGDDSTNRLDVVGPSATSAQLSTSLDPIAMFTADKNSIMTMQLQNNNAGTAAEMRFVTANNSGDYMAFTSPSSGNTGTFGGITKSTGHFIFGTGGTKSLNIINLNAEDLNFGTSNSTDMTIDSAGDIYITNNAKHIYMDDSGGTARSMLYFTSGNDMFLGDSNIDDAYLSAGTSDVLYLRNGTSKKVSVDTNGVSEFETFTAGESVVAGNLCYFKSDGKMWKTDASAVATAKGRLALANATISADASGEFIVKGRYTTSGLTAADEIFVSETAAAFTGTAPTTSSAVVRIIGYAMSTTELFFSPDNTYVELA